MYTCIHTSTYIYIYIKVCIIYIYIYTHRLTIMEVKGIASGGLVDCYNQGAE